ncbi:hypothetical protein FB451DRAFT_1554860 [Mycena latifolia]|nr:hypothetical protein FB451DRAFT_1554860 [Mycena latifolia]
MPPKSSASSATRKKHARKAGGPVVETEAPPPREKKGEKLRSDPPRQKVHVHRAAAGFAAGAWALAARDVDRAVSTADRAPAAPAFLTRTLMRPDVLWSKFNPPPPPPSAKRPTGVADPPPRAKADELDESAPTAARPPHRRQILWSMLQHALIPPFLHDAPPADEGEDADREEEAEVEGEGYVEGFGSGVEPDGAVQGTMWAANAPFKTCWQRCSTRSACVCSVGGRITDAGVLCAAREPLVSGVDVPSQTSALEMTENAHTRTRLPRWSHPQIIHGRGRSCTLLANVLGGTVLVLTARCVWCTGVSDCEVRGDLRRAACAPRIRIPHQLVGAATLEDAPRLDAFLASEAPATLTLTVLAQVLRAFATSLEQAAAGGVPPSSFDDDVALLGATRALESWILLVILLPLPVAKNIELLLLLNSPPSATTTSTGFTNSTYPFFTCCNADPSLAVANDTAAPDGTLNVPQSVLNFPSARLAILAKSWLPFVGKGSIFHVSK